MHRNAPRRIRQEIAQRVAVEMAKEDVLRLPQY
jgi:hypothetical protein